MLLAAGLLVVASLSATANPNGGVVRYGNATIAGQGTPQVDVTQHSQGAVLSWEHFNIAPGEVTNFHQPNANATAINRILQQDPSKIFGALNANGNVYLINPNGFLFGATAKINTHSFAAMTGIDAEDLKKLSGGYDASAQSAPGAKIENHGAIQAGDGGFVYLIAPRVENGKDAVITTPQGEVLLAAGATVTLTDDASGIGLGIHYTAPGEPGGRAVNLGKLVANGGFARMRAEFVRQGGVVQANAVRERAGKIELYATNSLTLESGSITDASGGAGAGTGGEITAKSEGDAEMQSGALLDISGGAAGGDAGTAELSAKGELALGGTLRAGAQPGSKRGSIVIDPTVLAIPSGVSLQGAGSIVAEASQRIEVASNATIDLASAGDGSADRQSLTLRSGGDISFGRDAKIEDDGSGAGGQKIWDVNLVAGADLANADLLALTPGSSGSIYLSGASFDPATGAFRSLGTNNGELSLTHGDLTVRAAGDLVVGNGGGLKDQTGQIDIAVGGNVTFRARRDVDSVTGAPIEGVIENGSGDISIVAGGSIDLAESPNTSGNAAIRTRGVVGSDAQGQTTISNGGSIYIQAGGDVDAGVGNRWLEPGPSVTPQDYADLVGQLPPDQAPPPGYVPPAFDPMPVVGSGILGIGTEAGGNVTIVAGGSVRTGASSVTRSGATASGLGTQYNGSHIGVFGRPIVRAIDYLTGVVRNALIEGAPESHLTVVAGDAIEGDFVTRNGQADFRAGYALAGGVTARTLDPTHLDAALVESSSSQADMTHGWFGTLARPVTVDLVEASMTGVGRNGVAIRAIEDPALVYPPTTLGTSAVPTWRPTDFAKLRSPDGDVILVGNDISMPTAASSGLVLDNLMRVLPPNVSIETDRGDLVLLNDFLIYPSDRGGLDLQIGGMVRTADLSASTNAVLALTLLTTGTTGNLSFNIPTGTRLRDPSTGNTYTITNALTVNSRTPALPAQGNVVFHLSPDAGSGAFTVPAGTLVRATDGHLYQVTSDAPLLAPEQRLSQGQVTFFASGGGALGPIRIPAGTILVGPGGASFQVAKDGTMDPGQVQITLDVTASAGSPGVDAPAFGLSLANPIAGIDRATNPQATIRPTDITASVIALDVGSATNAFPLAVTAIVGSLPGVESVANSKELGGGADLAPFGRGKSIVSSLTTGDAPLVKASVLGPAGELPAGTQLVIDDPSVLPPGVLANDLLITVDAIAVGAGVAPTLYRELTPDGRGRLRPDPAPGTVASVSPVDTWIRDDGGISARIKQSDADPGIDGRSINGSFDYYAYLSNCRSGIACGDLGTLGTGPTHADDPERASLRALGGFDRVQIELAKPAFVLTGDPGPDNLFGTADDGADGSLVDFALLAQNNRPSDETVVWAPIGNAILGAVPPAPGVAPDPFSGLQVAGPGSAKFLIGVLPNAPQVDRNGNGRIDPEESTGDRNGDGHIDRGEWQGSPDVFTHLDESQRTVNLGSSGPFFSPRLVLDGTGDGILTPAEAPYVPSGHGGEIQLAGAFSTGIGSELPLSLGLQTIGNVRDPILPLGSANLTVVADGEIDLGARGSIETYQGGRLFVESVSAGVSAGVPPAGFRGRRGIVTLFRGPGFKNAPADPSGGGPIGIDVDGDFNIGGLALAALSASDITVYSRDGSIDAGISTPFSSPNVFVGADGVVNVSYEGGGIFAGGGNLGLFVKKEVRIGAGITGNTINIVATDVSGGGTGGIKGATVDISATGTISGSISASGSINVSGGATAQGASLSAGGIVAGVGAGVGSNTGGGKVSSELNDLGDRAAQVGAAGFQTAQAIAAGEHHSVVIQVTSRVIGEPDADEADSKKRR